MPSGAFRAKPLSSPATGPRAAADPAAVEQQVGQPGLEGDDRVAAEQPVEGEAGAAAVPAEKVDERVHLRDAQPVHQRRDRAFDRLPVGSLEGEPSGVVEPRQRDREEVGDAGDRVRCRQLQRQPVRDQLGAEPEGRPPDEVERQPVDDQGQVGDREADRLSVGTGQRPTEPGALGEGDGAGRRVGGQQRERQRARAGEVAEHVDRRGQRDVRVQRRTVAPELEEQRCDHLDPPGVGLGAGLGQRGGVVPGQQPGQVTEDVGGPRGAGHQPLPVAPDGVDGVRDEGGGVEAGHPGRRLDAEQALDQRRGLRAERVERGVEGLGEDATRPRRGRPAGRRGRRRRSAGRAPGGRRAR